MREITKSRERGIKNFDLHGDSELDRVLARAVRLRLPELRLTAVARHGTLVK